MLLVPEFVISPSSAGKRLSRGCFAMELAVKLEEGLHDPIM